MRARDEEMQGKGGRELEFGDGEIASLGGGGGGGGG